MTNVLRAKLLMLGDSCVGKTAIIQQFINSGAAFPKNYSMTLGADVQTKTINIPDTSDVVELTMIDCSGKTINNDILTKLAQGTSLVVAVIDVTREDSVSEAKSWIGSLLEGKTVPGVILANKTDLTERRTVPAKLGLDLASSLKMQYFECSAKDNVGVEEVFFYLANEFHKLHAEQASNIASIA